MLSDCVAAGVLDALTPPDRARALRLAGETLRGLERADRLLAKHLRKAPPLSVRNALRLGTVELCQGEAAHGVVNAMVQIVAGHPRYTRLKGLANAVLRKVADAGPDEWQKLRVPRLPKWLRPALVDAWGPQAVARMEAAHFAGAPLDLTPHPGREVAPGPLDATLLATGSLRRQVPGQVSALPGYDTGDWWVQDAAAAMAARVLAPRPDESVLDLCAAPGGKTLQIAAAGARVTAVDVSGARLAVLHENLARTGLQATVAEADALTWTGSYDAILLDAPCSATGTIRRHPDLPHVRDGSGIGDLIDLQTRLIDHAWTLLRPGGRMVFCTCSLIPDEGEVQVSEALARTPDMRIDRAALDLPGVEPDWLSDEGGLRLRPDYWPDLGGMDGFYIASLQKMA